MPRVLVADSVAIAEAARLLARGGLVAFPTETVYGLGARGLHGAEVARIFAAKDWPATHPLILHVGTVEQARALSSAWPDAADALARALWPGPLTLVVPRAPHVPREVTGGLDTVAVRAPAHPVAIALLAAVDEPLAAPSANAHTHVSPTTAAHVVRSLGERVDLVLDGGPCLHGIESTVVECTGAAPRVLRPGSMSLEALRRVVPGILYSTVVAQDGELRASPGLAAKHYAPRAPVTLCPRGAPIEDPEAVAIVVTSAARAARVITLPDDAEGYARGIFAALHEAEEARPSRVVIESPPDDLRWWAIADRLRRAAEP